MEERILALDLPKEIKMFISSLFFGVESVSWVEKEQIFLPIIYLHLQDPSFDIDIMERLFSISYEPIYFCLKGVDFFYSKGKQGKLFVLVEPIEEWQQFKKTVEKALKPIPIKISKSCEKPRIPIAYFEQKGLDAKLADWMQTNYLFSSPIFCADRCLLLTPLKKQKGHRYLLKGKIDLKSKDL